MNNHFYFFLFGNPFILAPCSFQWNENTYFFFLSALLLLNFLPSFLYIFNIFHKRKKYRENQHWKTQEKAAWDIREKLFFFQRWLRVVFEEKTLNHVGSHVDIKTCSKMAIDEVFTLINPMENHFCAPLVSKNMLSQWWCETGFNELFPFYTQIQSMCVLWRVCTTCPFQLSRENIIE